MGPLRILIKIEEREPSHAFSFFTGYTLCGKMGGNVFYDLMSKKSLNNFFVGANKWSPDSSSSTFFRSFLDKGLP